MTSCPAGDLALFGDWKRLSLSYGGGSRAGLERKSLPGAADGKPNDETERLWRLLDEMTTELREQFRFFRMLRAQAEPQAQSLADDAAGKLARADVKAAADALAMMVRTLERIDALQRQLAQDRQLAAEAALGGAEYDEAVAFFLKRIDVLAEEKALAKMADGGRGTA